ncbi:transposase [Skermanella aerolata]
MDEKTRIVAEAAAPGSSVSEVARRHDISGPVAWLVGNWRVA